MEALKKVGNFLLNLLGFRVNSRYVKKYLNDANIRSSIYMASIVIILEVWMIIRQTIKYIAPGWANAPSGFNLIFSYISLYLLFIMASISMLIFAINYLKKKQTNKDFITNLVVGGLSFFWILLLILENHVGTLRFNNSNNVIASTTTILVYVSLAIFGAAICGYTLYRHKFNKNSTVLSIVVISCFALICLLFGIKVGYSDFAHPTSPTDPKYNVDKIKMITCFLTMIIFVACLLIWKPYISIIMLTSIFIFFLELLKSYEGREFLDGDQVNYFTFLISLTMVTVSIYQQRVAEAKKDEKLIHTAQYDGLIDVFNTRHLSELIEDNSKENINYKDNKIFLFINIFNFKIINNQRGFDAGDNFLKDFAKAAQKAFPNDLISRQADDHFIIYTNVDGVDKKIDELNNYLKSVVGNLFISLKVGGYRPRPDEKTNRSIDKARYACNKIHNKFEVTYFEYDEKMDKEFEKYQYIINSLDEAIEKGYVQAFYQPVVWGNDKTLCGAEALARWIDPIYGFLSPADFIPVLEEARLIHKLDAAIIEYVCKNMRIAIDANRPVVPISINFSRIDFELMDVKKEVDERIKKYNIDKQYIHIEITESALSEKMDLLTKQVNALKNDGYAIWLDDFGSGYSSLNVLKDFDFDVVKIDMEFLKNFDTNSKTKDILECIITLADRLHMMTLTEGVETKSQADFLKEIGCGRLQGYLFGKPMKLEDFEDKINKKELVISNHVLQPNTDNKK